MLIFRATKFVQLRLTTNDPTIVFVAQRSPKKRRPLGPISAG